MLVITAVVGSADDAVLTKQFMDVRPLLRTFCHECHSSDARQGELDLERFETLEAVRQDLKPWQAMIQQLETREMPPRDQQQPSVAERQQIIDWAERLLENEAKRRAGERGNIPLHRLSNAEYDNTVRDLTGIDLKPARDFPADGAAGEGFTNAAEALGMSPALMGKYTNAAKQIADHVVLLPEGFRFSKYSTRRDWTDENLAEIRAFYGQFTEDGQLPLNPYLNALLQHRDDLRRGSITVSQLASERELNPVYLGVLWDALTDSRPSFPLDRVRSLWNNAATGISVEPIVDEVSSWSERLWKFPKIGSYVSLERQVAKQPTFVESDTIAVAPELVPGQRDVVLYLTASQITESPVPVTWENPRLVGADGSTLFLRDYASFGSAFELDHSRLFGRTASYLSAVIEAAFDVNLTVETLSAKYGIDPLLLRRWINVAALQPRGQAGDEGGRVVPPVEWSLLDAPAPTPGFPAINGWSSKRGELPILIANASDKTELVPGRMTPHSVAVHPTPTEFVAVVWTSPINGRVRAQGKVLDAHDACGNGFAWWIEKRSSARSVILAEGSVDLGKSNEQSVGELHVESGDQLLLGIDAREGSHVCDLTEIAFSIDEIGTTGIVARRWDLAGDVVDEIGAGNPHNDSYGNVDVWSFVKGPAKDRPLGAVTTPGETLLSKWRQAAADEERRDEASRLAEQIQALLNGPRGNDTDPDLALYDQLVSLEGPLLKALELSPFAASSRDPRYGLPQELFGNHPSGKPVDSRSVVTTTGDTLEIRLPAALFRDRKFVVDGKLDADAVDAVVQIHASTQSPSPDAVWDGNQPMIALADGEGRRQLLAGLDHFRDVFPPFICYPHIIPTDEVVCLKAFHREDGPLQRLFLNDEQRGELDRLWHEHRFITKFPVVENEYLPLFIGFVTQDQPKESLEFFESKRPEFQQRADEFEQEFEHAATRQIEQLLRFASRAYRRPLSDSESNGLISLYRALRDKAISHEEAFRSLIARVLMSPSFLLHLEQAGETERSEVNAWELASRLSYFLWASMPDQELRDLAATGELTDSSVLSAQVARMLADDRIRSLAVEFGTQWIHVRGFDQFNDKNETQFPGFKALRSAMYEESILVFETLFRGDGSATDLIDADHTFLNEALAKHYGIEGVRGPQFRRVDGVKEYGRGGVLSLASVLSKQAGASRTSPILRGNWIVETLLGEKLPLPPPNVPRLPQSEIGNGGLTMREITRRHVSDPQCASCHQRIDPFGFALEHYDPIGRRRNVDLGGLPVDASATLRDGTEFEGLDGLRDYLLHHKKETFVRLFYQRLLGYALGRAVSISDQNLLDEIMRLTDNGNSGVSEAIVAIVNSTQFRRAGR